MSGKAGDALRDGDALLAGLVREHGSANQVSDGPDPIDTGEAVRIDLDETTSVHAHAAVFSEQSGACGLASDRHEQPVAFERLLPIAVLIADAETRCLFLHRFDPAAEADVEPLLAELALGQAGHVAVEGGQELGQRLQDHDLRAQATPDAAHFRVRSRRLRSRQDASAPLRDRGCRRCPG